MNSVTHKKVRCSKLVEESVLQQQTQKKGRLVVNLAQKKQIKDKVTRRVRALLIKCLYLYIAMTTPPKVVKYQKSTTDWPHLKAYRSHLKNGEKRRNKTVIMFMTGSESDKSELIDALEDGIMSDNEQLQSLYDPVFAFNVDDAVKTDHFRFDTVRGRPPARVLQLEEILPSISYHWCLMPIQGDGRQVNKEDK